MDLELLHHCFVDLALIMGLELILESFMKIELLLNYLIYLELRPDCFINLELMLYYFNSIELMQDCFMKLEFILHELIIIMDFFKNNNYQWIFFFN